MQLLQSWKDSLLFFSPKNFQYFFLITLKLFLESFKLLSLYGLPFITFFIFSPFISNSVLLKYKFALSVESNFFIRLFLPLFSFLVVFILLLLLTRPSIKKKTFSYFKEYIISGSYFIFMLLFLAYLLFYFFKFFFVLTSLVNTTLMFFLVPIYIFTGLFFFDSKQRLEDFLYSLLKAFKLTLYSCPFLLVLLLFLYVLTYFASLVVTFDLLTSLNNNFIIGRLILVFVSTIIVSVFSNFYINQVHNQFNLYYKK